MEPTENNKLIAEFMRVVFHDDENQYYNADGLHIGNTLQYHTSWDWLMPVVEKIEYSYKYDVEILQYGTRVLENGVEIITNVADFSFDKKIEHCYDAVVEFINSYD